MPGEVMMFETDAAEPARPLPVPRAPTSTTTNARDAPEASVHRRVRHINITALSNADGSPSE